MPIGEFFAFCQKVLPDLIQGTGVTLKIAGGALLIGLVVGLPVALLRVYGSVWLRRLAGAYINLFRGTPLLVQLFVVYYGLPDLGLTFSRLAAAYLTLGLNSGAYQAEYLRGALQAVGSGQMTAARAIGMSRLTAIRHIILPQALRLVLPSWSNEMIAIIKYTAVVFLIAVPDLMGKAKIISSRTFAPISTYIIVALIYLVVVGLASIVLHHVGKRFETPGLENPETATR
ncbi:amino acid ABC transporter permease [Desulfosarcina ovata]|uniref:ABC transporter permease n=2 Tax=Desulfosarcina ovata TaxID=83564 RepID=A0A5K8AHY7_9BACT|nr:amino acid ABC transporter permease [Desulfosarcina ovata]BBO85286.1 ABC transporter permease [Desulfosarcina ovata subsp. sediminis]BBO92178.1 ABC transporter permease [Desulfosarcina ovata subsp. ovata]